MAETRKSRTLRDLSSLLSLHPGGSKTSSTSTTLSSGKGVYHGRWHGLLWPVTIRSKVHQVNWQPLAGGVDSFTKWRRHRALGLRLARLSQNSSNLGPLSEFRVRAVLRPARRSTSDEPTKQTMTHAAARLVDMQLLHTCSPAGSLTPRHTTLQGAHGEF